MSLRESHDSSNLNQMGVAHQVGVLNLSARSHAPRGNAEWTLGVPRVPRSMRSVGTRK